MTIGKYRSRRNRAIPQPASLGAPLRGVFMTQVLGKDFPTGQAVIETIDLDDAGELVSPKTWTPGKSIDPKAVMIWVDSAPIPIISITVNAQGNSLAVQFAPTGVAGPIKVVPGHPALTALNGSICGGVVAQ